MAAEQAERPEPGTLWVAPNGDAYRLTGWMKNPMAEDWATAPVTTPVYLRTDATGLAPNMAVSELPADAVLVWKP